MGEERLVISVHYITRFGRGVAKYSFDYTAIEVGDWFIGRGAGACRRVEASMRASPKAKTMKFSREEISDRSIKFTRVR